MAIWLVFVGAMLLTGLMTLRLTRLKPLAPILVLLLLATARSVPAPDGLTSTRLSSCGSRRSVLRCCSLEENRGLVAFVAFASFAVRELTAGVLVFGLVTSLRTRRVCAVDQRVRAFGGVLRLHTKLTDRYVPCGVVVELPLFHTGGVGATLTMMGFGLPLGPFVGPVLWAAATRPSVRLRNDVALGLLVVPLSGIEISRHIGG